ncbi:MAG: hypothetical protein ABFD97_21200 [Syntrophobacter sp.]
MKKNAKSAHAPSRPPTLSMRQRETECLTAALELQSILEEESLILKRFGGTELLPLISRKQFSICELARKLDSLRPSQNNDFAISEPLKQTLRKIQAMNHSNRYFIQDSLSLCQDLLSILRPQGYGPADGAKAPHAPKGRSFNREV